MLFKKKTVSLVLSGVFALSMLAGCGTKAVQNNNEASAQNGKTQEITFYYGGSLNVKELWDTLIPMFEKEHKDVKVKTVYIAPGQGGDATVDRLIAAKKSGQKTVDIDLYDGGLSEIAKGNKEGIWEKADGSKIPNLSKMEEKVLSQTDYLGVPYRASSVVLAYNSKNVPEPPKTAKELYTWIKEHPGKFAYNDPATGGSGASFVQTAIYNFLPPDAMNSNNPAIMKEWDKGFALLKELGPYMYQKGVYPKKNQGTLDLLANGEVDMIPAWSDMALEQLNKKLLPDTIKLTQIEPAFTGGPSYLLMPKMSEKKEAVEKFINFVLTPEAQTIIVNKMYGYPGIKWSEMPSNLQSKFASVAKGYRTFNGGELEKELNKRWQREVAGQ